MVVAIISLHDILAGVRVVFLAVYVSAAMVTDCACAVIPVITMALPVSRELSTAYTFFTSFHCLPLFPPGEIARKARGRELPSPRGLLDYVTRLEHAIRLDTVEQPVYRSGAVLVDW